MRVDELLMGAGLKPRDRLVVLNPGAGRPDKRWPIESFSTLARRLGDEAGASVLVIWGPNELADARAIVGTERGRAVLAPPTNLDELLAVLRRASVMVAADTGPLHLAAALGTRCVGLYGPTAAERNGPYGRGHRSLQSPDATMGSLGVDDVFRATADLLDGPVAEPSASEPAR
jgi:ADP-heptose:LPS heptosyltransferase